MTPVRTPAIVRGDVPGLLRRGMPVTFTAEGLDGEPVECVGVVLDDAEPNTTWRVANLTDGVPADMYGDETRDMRPLWTDPAALYLSLHWLADRGHPGCLWMLPTTHGGRVEAWDGLTAWEVSAILVSHEVALRAAGRPGIARILGPWAPWDVTKTTRRGVRNYGHGGQRRAGIACQTDAHVSRQRWFYGGGSALVSAESRDYEAHPDTELWEAFACAAADTAALTDGCCLQVPGGLVVPA